MLIPDPWMPLVASADGCRLHPGGVDGAKGHVQRWRLFRSAAQLYSALTDTLFTAHGSVSCGNQDAHTHVYTYN